MYSPTYISAAVIVLVALFNLLKINIKQEEIEPIITAIITAVAGIVVIWRRYKQGDITILGKRK
jgi:hypothetical protein